MFRDADVDLRIREIERDMMPIYEALIEPIKSFMEYAPTVEMLLEDIVMRKKFKDAGSLNIKVINRKLNSNIL
jgi:hypothetical protein